MVRSFRDLKARLDRMEARSGDTFEAVSRKFAEIERSRNDHNGKNALRGWLFYGMLIATILGVLLVPMLFVLVVKITGLKRNPPAATPAAGPVTGGH